MKKILILSILVVGAGWAGKAQSTGATTAVDTARHRGMHHDWSHNGQSAEGQRSWDGQHRHGGRDGDMSRHGGFDKQRHGHDRGGFGEHIRYSPDQRKQLMTINMEYRNKQRDLYKQDNLTLGAYKSQLLSLQKEKRTKEKGLLTADQQTQLTQWHQRASENQQVMAAARLERLTIHLQLTDAQAAKIKAQEVDFMSHVQSIRNNDELMPDQKRDQMKSLFTQHQEAMASILTPDQLTKFKAMRHRGGPGGPGGHNGWQQGRQQD
jgi:hypothetical protein